MKLSYAIIGFDEVGRGSLAGPVVVAGVVDTGLSVPKHIVIRDSKKMTRLQRQKASNFICQNFAFGIGQATVAEIDKLGISKAVVLAARRARKKIEQSQISENITIINDGNLAWFKDGKALVKGDDKVPAISMASIIAKVYRDTLMINLALQFPNWGFERHVGYGTALHRQMIIAHGLLKNIHRKSYCRNIKA
ncbi:ribonuclease HII [Candidatus Beckwithbacteria bacterium]|nr:ribonuclease HII [Candidatus Beckwithbacteria bacterium]